MTDEAEDSGCTSQDPDDAVSTGGGGNNGNNLHISGIALTAAAVGSPSKKSKSSSVESAEVPGKRTCIRSIFPLAATHIFIIRGVYCAVVAAQKAISGKKQKTKSSTRVNSAHRKTSHFFG